MVQKKSFQEFIRSYNQRAKLNQVIAVGYSDKCFFLILLIFIWIFGNCIIELRYTALLRPKRLTQKKMCQFIGFSILINPRWRGNLIKACTVALYKYWIFSQRDSVSRWEQKILQSNQVRTHALIISKQPTCWHFFH